MLKSVWTAQPCTPLPGIRTFRHARLTAAVNARDYSGILMIDQLQIARDHIDHITALPGPGVAICRCLCLRNL